MDVMIDLETLSNNEDSVVVSIGVVVFDLEKKEILEEFYATLDIHSQLKKGRKILADTLKWWMKQPDAAKKVFAEDAQDPKAVLKALWAVLDKYRPLTVIGNGSGFDINIMENMYDMYEERLPWHYTHVNDLRTFIRFCGNKEKLVKSGTNHNALDDARSQVQYMFKHYKSTTSVQDNPDPRASSGPGADPNVPPPKLVIHKDLSDVITAQIASESKAFADKYLPKGASTSAQQLIELSYGTGSVEWALKLEANTKKMWTLVAAFREADEKLMGKELTQELMANSMTEVREALYAILGDKALHG